MGKGCRLTRSSLTLPISSPNYVLPPSFRPKTRKLYQIAALTVKRGNSANRNRATKGNKTVLILAGQEEANVAAKMFVFRVGGFRVGGGAKPVGLKRRLGGGLGEA